MNSCRELIHMILHGMIPRWGWLWQRPAGDQTFFFLSASVAFVEFVRRVFIWSCEWMNQKLSRGDEITQPRLNLVLHPFRNIWHIYPGSKMISWEKNKWIKLSPCLYFIFIGRGGDEQQVQQHMLMLPSCQFLFFSFFPLACSTAVIEGKSWKNEILAELLLLSNWKQWLSGLPSACCQNMKTI